MKVFYVLLFIAINSLALSAQNIPIDFEDPGNGAEWTWTTFENDANPALEIIPNPDVSGINTSATVAKFTALQAGQPFAGCESMHGADLGTFTISEDISTIRIMVWKSTISDVGIKLVRADGWSLGEIKIANTLVEQWEQLEFDFSGHLGNTYDQVVIFPDFVARDSDNIIYFDNIYGDVATPTSIATIEKTNTKLFPNPSSDFLTIQSDVHWDSYSIYSFTGQIVVQQQMGSAEESKSISIAQLPKGMYLLELNKEGQTLTRKFLKD